MARVQLVIADADRDRFVHQARREGMSLSAWLRAAAEDRLRRCGRSERFQSAQELEDFFSACDEKEPGVEPDWEEHLGVIASSRRKGVSDT